MGGAVLQDFGRDRTTALRALMKQIEHAEEEVGLWLDSDIMFKRRKDGTWDAICHVGK